VPDDPHAVRDARYAERVRSVDASELRVAAGPVGGRPFGDGNGVDRLTGTQRDVSVRAAERAGEVENDLLPDEQRTVPLDLNVDRRSRQRVGLGERTRGRDERRRGECEDDAEQTRQVENCTAGASRAAPSASK